MISHYVRNLGAFDLETAVHKMTGLAARHVGITDRGNITPGMYADLVLFDPALIRDRASIEQPSLMATGIERVWINGVEVLSEGQSTGAYPGRIVTRN